MYGKEAKQAALSLAYDKPCPTKKHEGSRSIIIGTHEGRLQSSIQRHERTPIDSSLKVGWSKMPRIDSLRLQPTKVKERAVRPTQANLGNAFCPGGFGVGNTGV